MFGYVRPEKGSLLMREFSRFRCIYCGICKEIKSSYGNIPRPTLTYDMTFLALLLISLSDTDGVEEMDTCILNPVKKKPILFEHEALKRTAALSVLFFEAKLADDVADTKNYPIKLAKRAGSVVIRQAYKKARMDFPEYARAISEGLERLSKIEQNFAKTQFTEYDDSAEKAFGMITGDVFKESFLEYFNDDANRELLIEGMQQFGFFLGRWIYLLDAIDDYKEDRENGSPNPLTHIEYNRAREITENAMMNCEQNLDLIAALLPYRRDSGIICNVVQKGLPDVRRKIFAGKKLNRL
jgi:hypothetical protein